MATFPQINPKTSEVFHSYAQMKDEDLQRIIERSGAAQQEWRRLPVGARIEALSGLSQILRAKADDGAALIQKEMGKPLAQAKAEIGKCAGLVDWYAEHGGAFLADTAYPPLPGFKSSYVTYQPLGVVLSIMPWNFPWWQVIRMSVPTLLAGNAVVLKHAPNCFGSGLAIEEIFDSLPVPKGLFRSLIIDVPQTTAVLEHPFIQGVALTGSERAGRAVAAKAGALLKKAVVELGGSDGYVVLSDADVDAAADAVVNARLLNTGQVCIAPKRTIVEKSVKVEFERKVVEKLANKMYDVDFGPMVHAQARDEVARQVEATISSGAKVLAGSLEVQAPEDAAAGGAFLQPMVLTDVTPGMAAFDEEIFGPVISITEAESEEHAVELANKTCYGLGGAVFTRDIAKGERIAVNEIESGMCFVNDFVRSDSSLPFGGVKASGLGRECAAFGLLEFVNVKTICVK